MEAIHEAGVQNHDPRTSSGQSCWKPGRELDADPRYESAWLFDHFYPIYGSDEGPCLEAWVTLSALAQATERIRVGSMVNAAPYRHPGVCAAMASSLDIVSNGRLGPRPRRRVERGRGRGLRDQPR